MEGVILEALRNDKPLERLIELVDAQRTNNLRAYNARNQHVGAWWEAFCVKYLREILGWEAARVDEWADDVLESLALRRRDMGIDLLARSDQGYVAVQCKFRVAKRELSWRDLATFDALCMRSGPWVNRVVMTTATGVRRQGLADPSERFWGRRHFEALPRHTWLRLAGCGEGHVLGGPSHSDIRMLRCARFERGTSGDDATQEDA